MMQTTSSIQHFMDTYDHAALAEVPLDQTLTHLLDSESLKDLLNALTNSPAFSETLGTELASVGAIEGVSACRNLRSSYNLSLSRFVGQLAELFTAFDANKGSYWKAFADRVSSSDLGRLKVMDCLRDGAQGAYYHALSEQLVAEQPELIFPTSSYRDSDGYVVSTADDQHTEAVMELRIFTSVRVVDRVLDPAQPVLRDVYVPFGRCVCVVDQNVEEFYGEEIDAYFAHHDIQLHKLVYRSMEVDKNIRTVERMLGDFKRLGVSRNQPVLVIGGGVLTDNAGFACALYHRSTPYVMVSTSIVAGIDAGPSPRTCSDGFGYKNLFGAYHPPVLSITDRSFFKTLKDGWIRHGIAEIIKMGAVKDVELLDYLEAAGPRLVSTRFGTINCLPGDKINELSRRILGTALRSYVEAEYDNLYETHQCRPHAFGHTWSPGFEIAAGLLHGHAVSIGMGFGAYLSYRHQWIDEADFRRILDVIALFDLSLWDDILLDKEILWAAQEKMVEKRGHNLAAPLPKGRAGQCGYLNALPRTELYASIEAYQAICATYPRQGRGIEPLCSDVGLEDPSTVVSYQIEPAA